MISLLGNTIMCHEAASMLEHGVWDNLCSLDMVTQAWLQNKLSMPFKMTAGIVCCYCFVCV